MAVTSTTTRATFAIYRDEPEASPPQPKAPSHPSPAISNTPTSPITNRIAIACIKEKENVNPLTGFLPTLEQKLAKKRKTGGVLATKIVISTKGHKEAQPEPKKRRIASKAKTRAEKEKEKRVLGTRKERSVRVRKATDLPRVEEEEEEEVKEKERVAQSLADSRCYELTVMPLADVSEAYSPAVSAADEVKDVEEASKKCTSKVRVCQLVFRCGRQLNDPVFAAFDPLSFPSPLQSRRQARSSLSYSSLDIVHLVLYAGA